MVLLIIWIAFIFSPIDHCLSLVIPIRNIIPSNNSTHTLRVRIHENNSHIERLVTKRQFDLLEIHFQQRNIPYQQIENNQNGLTIVIGRLPLHLTTNEMMRNQTTTLKQGQIHSEHFPLSLDTHEYNLIRDQESYEFRKCLESCEVFEDKEFRPDHDCIRQKCLKEITGI